MDRLNDWQWIVLEESTDESKLFYFSNQIHLFHLQTRVHAQHVALEELYDGLNDKKDAIPEILMGRLGTNITDIACETYKDYSVEQLDSTMDDLTHFVQWLIDWADEEDYDEVEDEAIELMALVNKTKYLLQFK